MCWDVRLGLGSQPGISLVVSHTYSDDLEDTDQPVILSDTLTRNQVGLSGALSGVGPESASAASGVGAYPSYVALSPQLLQIRHGVYPEQSRRVQDDIDQIICDTA